MPITEFIQSVGELDARMDDNFRHYYVETQSLRTLGTFENRGYLAVGLKGIGKSGAYKFLTEIDGNAHLSVGVAVANVDLHLTKTGFNCLKAARLFRRNIATYILTEIVKKKELHKRIRQDLLQKAIQLETDLSGKLKSVLSMFGGVSILGFGFSVKSAGKAEKDELAALGQSNEPEQLLKQICDGGLKIRVVIDDPDRLLAPGQAIDSELIAGICLASFELSKNTANLKIIVLLKSHVYGQIRKIDEMNNIPSDVVTILHWEREELKEVLTRRADFAKLSLNAIFVEKDYQPENLSCDLYNLSRNGARDCLRRVELCLKATPRHKLGKQELQNTLVDYAARCRDQMTAVYGEQYPGIFEFVEALFSQDPQRHFLHSDFHAAHQQLMLNEEKLLDLFKQPWARQWTSFRAALVESGSIAFVDGPNLILPYEEGYYSGDAATQYAYAVVPAFTPLLRRAALPDSSGIAPANNRGPTQAGSGRRTSAKR